MMKKIYLFSILVVIQFLSACFDDPASSEDSKEAIQQNTGDTDTNSAFKFDPEMIQFLLQN